MEPGQNVGVWRGGLSEFSYLVPDAANTTAATWYCAADAASLPGGVLLSLAAGSGITLQNTGATLEDLLVTVRLQPAQTEALPTGYLHCELWLDLQPGAPVMVATGALTVHDSLRA
jgi:hypothetical protein